MPVDILTLSTKGQLVLPNELRKSLSLNSGDKLMVYWSADSIVLKKFEFPDVSDFEKAIDETVMLAKKAGMKKEDINSAIKEYRAEKRK